MTETPRHDPPLTDRALRAVELAGHECQAVRHSYLGSEHLLAGLVREAEDHEEQALVGLTPHAVRREFVRIIPPGHQVPEGEIPFSPRVQRVLRYALEESRRLGHAEIDTGLLLLGVLNLGDGVAARVLRRLDVDTAKAHREILTRLTGEPPHDGSHE